MFSERLEGLIKAAMQDGILTDKEKQAILKRAEAEGEDPTEVEIYIESLLQKEQQTRRKQEDEKDEQLYKEKQAAIGKVCPNCGKHVPPLTIKCDCGFEFSDIRRGKSPAEILSEKIDKITNAPIRSNPQDDEDAYYDEINNREMKICDTISVIPVPNTKEDIIDFLALSAPNSKPKGGIVGTLGGRIGLFVIIPVIISVVCFIVDNALGFFVSLLCFAVLVIGTTLTYMNAKKNETFRWNKRARVWRAKFDQVLMKGRSLRGDPEFQHQLDYYEKMVK